MSKKLTDRQQVQKWYKERFDYNKEEFSLYFAAIMQYKEKNNVDLYKAFLYGAIAKYNNDAKKELESDMYDK